MNKRITELWEQSAQRTDIMDEHRHEQFAKLIITDIINIVSDSKSYNKCVHTTHDLGQAQCVVAEISKKIYEEFL